MSLPDKSDVVITHYGTTNFSNDNKSTEILWIGAIYYIKGEKKYFYEETEERSTIEEYFKFIQHHKGKTFIHWSMNSPAFGFLQIAARYQYLTKEDGIVFPERLIDLSEYLKDKYGINYISREGGRLNNLARLNGFSGIMPEGESVVNPGIQAVNRLELIFSTYQAEFQDTLLTNATVESLYPEYFKSFGYELITKCIESIDKDNIALAPVSAFIHLMRRDGLLTDATDKSIFYFIGEHFNLNLGKSNCLKSFKTVSKNYEMMYKNLMISLKKGYS